MKPLFFILAITSFITLTQACNSGTTSHKEDSVDSAREANDSTPSVNKDASDFMTKAASGDMLEVQLGQMAQQKGISQRARDFGLMMIHDHSKNADELKTLAQRKGIIIPQTLSDDHQEHLHELAKQTGNDFDKAYIDMMEKDHQEDIDEYQKAANNINNPAVKAYAKNTIPVLHMHLDSVLAIKESLK